MGGSDQPVGFMMVVRDVTDQNRLESELRDSERRYRGLVEGLSEGVLILKGGLIVYANPAAEVICGARVQQLIQTRWRDRLATRDVLVVEDALASIEGGKTAREELRCTLDVGDGESSSEVRVTASPVEFAGGAAVLLLVQDETAERRIEGELRRNEARLDAVLEATSDGILVLSEDRHARSVQMTNRSFAQMFGLSVSEVLGSPESTLVARLEAMGSGAEHVAALIGAGASAGVTSVTVGDREVQVTVATLTSRRGESVGRVVACRDVSEQHESQRQLQAQAEKLQLSKLELEQSYSRLNEINSDLEARGKQLDELNQELRRLDEMKSNLLGNVSHELQTPLVSIRGYTEMILKERLGPISEEQRKGLTLSLKNIDRLISMIDNLLAFSRTDPGARELRLTRFALGPVVREVVDLLRQRAEAKELNLEFALGNDEIWLQADRDKIVQVLLNLLGNAVKFTARRGRIDLTVHGQSEGHVNVSVRDTGVGIPAEELTRIFDRHYQVARDDREAREGSGIGLAIVRDILRLHGCTIQVRSEEGVGTEFEFTLPLSDSQRDAGPAEATSSESGGLAVTFVPEDVVVDPAPVEIPVHEEPVQPPVGPDDVTLDDLVPEQGEEGEDDEVSGAPERGDAREAVPDTVKPPAGQDPAPREDSPSASPRPRLRIIRRHNNEG
jgi:PAS domain S-box-containing protein